MAKKHEEVEKIEQTRKRISEITELIALEKPLINTMKEYPLATVAVLLFIGILTAFVSRSIVKMFLSLISFTLKAAAFFYFLKQGLSFIKRIKSF